MSIGHYHPLAGMTVDTSRDDERVAHARAERAAGDAFWAQLADADLRAARSGDGWCPALQDGRGALATLEQWLPHPGREPATLDDDRAAARESVWAETFDLADAARLVFAGDGGDWYRQQYFPVLSSDERGRARNLAERAILERTEEIRAERRAEEQRKAERQQFEASDNRWSALAALRR